MIGFGRLVDDPSGIGGGGNDPVGDADHDQHPVVHRGDHGDWGGDGQCDSAGGLFAETGS